MNAEGQEMTDALWAAPDSHALAMLLHGEATDEQDDRGRPVKGDTLLLLINAGDRERRFTLPPAPGVGAWVAVIDTTRPREPAVKEKTMTLARYSLVLLRFGNDKRLTLEVESLHQKAEAIE